jgi:hypothetical protein
MATSVSRQLVQTRVLTCALCCACFVAPAVSSQTVTEQHGDIYFSDKSGSKRRISEFGNAHDPALSANKTQIVFVREVGTRTNEGLGGTPATAVSQLWVAGVANRQGPALLINSPIEIRGRRFWAFHSPQFSADNKSVYFLVDFAATSSAIARVSVADKRVEFIAAGVLGFSVISGGKYGGYLIAHEHRAKLAPGYFDWYWLLKATGEEIGVIGEDENDASLFLEMYQETTQDR